MTRRGIIDTGPLLALVSEENHHHQWMVNVWKELKAPVLTCEAVLTEAAFLVVREGKTPDRILEFVERGLIKVEFQAQREVASLRALLLRYRSVPMSLADACLVRLSELHSQSVLLTFDSDFRIYRRFGNKVIPLAMPD